MNLALLLIKYKKASLAYKKNHNHLNLLNFNRRIVLKYLCCHYYILEYTVRRSVYSLNYKQIHKFKLLGYMFVSRPEAILINLVFVDNLLLSLVELLNDL